MNPQSSCGRQRSGFLPDRTVHLHPLARCNLTCSHCYSTSSPQAKAMLAPEVLLAALPRLRSEGYDVISLSGGEPLLYPALAEVTAEARHLGFRLAAISNGFRVAPAYAGLVASLDALAISFDGMEANHLAIRRHPKAWRAAVDALRWLRDIGKPAAAAFTVSRDSLAEVPEFVEMVAGLGVRAVQLRPLVMAGRAVDEVGGFGLSEADQRRLWLMAQTLSLAYEGEVAVHVDLAPAPALVADSGAWAGLIKGDSPALADLVNPLVITPSGRLKPFTFDFPSEFDLGDLAQLGHSALTSQVARLGRLVSDSLNDLTGQTGFVDWFAYLRDCALARTPAHP